MGKELHYFWSPDHIDGIDCYGGVYSYRFRDSDLDLVRAEDFDRVSAERDQLQCDLDVRDQEIDRLRTLLKSTEKEILKHQAEQPMSLRLSRNLTKARTAIKKALENKE
jgi:hypothetical protein